jgi:chromosome segregation ATPase
MLSSPALTEEQRQMLIDNSNRRLDKIRRIEDRLDKLKGKYPKAKMFAIVQEQLEEIKAQLGTV